MYYQTNRKEKNSIYSLKKEKKTKTEIEIVFFFLHIHKIEHFIKKKKMFICNYKINYIRIKISRNNWNLNFGNYTTLRNVSGLDEYI